MQKSNTRSSLLSVYFSKESIGVVHFNRTERKMECGMIQCYVPSSKQILQSLIELRKVEQILTNNDKHLFLQNIADRLPTNIVSENGLQDDIIENNLNLFRFNPIKEPIQNKSQYIKLMREHSQSLGSFKEKYKALGIILYYLLNEEDFSIATTLYLNDMSYFFDRIFKHIIVSNSELQKLEIIKQEVHPSLIKGKGKSKQGFSVLSLYETTLLSAGSKRILRNFFRNPTYDKIKLQQRLHLITWLKKFNSEFKNLFKVFRTLHSVDAILKKFVECRVQSDDWRKLAKTLETMIILHKTLEEKARIDETKLPNFLQGFFQKINWPQIAKVLSSITSNISLQQGTIKRGVDAELDELKKTYDNLPHLLTVYARQQKWGSDIRIIFMSQIGYLIRVPHEIEIPKLEEEEWTLQFIKNSGKFYCNGLTKTLDEQFGDIYGEITDREKKISFELENIVSEYCNIIQEAYWKCCQLECFVGIAVISNGMCPPRLSSESLIISRGWHLLLAQDAIENHGFSFNQTLAPKERVYNSEQNLVNTNYSNRIMLITGPNGSGKTIYMKQIAMIIFLTHLGFYVPAEFAEVPLIDKMILLESRRSIYRGNNGFQSEISSLSKITTPGLITNKSFVLIDELGASIETIFAKKILTALIQYLINSETHIEINQDLEQIGDKFKIPLTVMITHITEVMSSNMIHQNYLLRYLTMDMQKDETYLFKIKPGLVKKGYGIECAKAFMDKSFIKRAQKIWSQIKYKT